MVLQLSYFGKFQVFVDDAPLTNFQTDKVRALLAYLGVERQAHQRSALAQFLWPGYSEESANNSLRQTLHRLRQVLHDAEATPPWLLITRQTIQRNGLAASADEVALLVENYSGNPLALQLTAATIADFFGGDVAAFQREEGNLFDGIRLVLDQQFARLSPLEREILVWLAMEREPITVSTLRANLVQPVPTNELLEALQGLQNRSLLEKREQGLTLQSVIIEYTTEYLVEQVCREISDGLMTRRSASSAEPWQGDRVTESPPHPVTLSFLNRFALLKTQAKEYVQQSQARLILQPVAAHWRKQWGQRAASRQGQEMQRIAHARHPSRLCRRESAQFAAPSGR